MVRGTGEGLSVGAPFGWREWPMGLMVVRGRWGAREKVSWCFGCSGRWRWRKGREPERVKYQRQRSDFSDKIKLFDALVKIRWMRKKGVVKMPNCCLNSTAGSCDRLTQMQMHTQKTKGNNAESNNEGVAWKAGLHTSEHIFDFPLCCDDNSLLSLWA